MHAARRGDYASMAELYAYIGIYLFLSKEASDLPAQQLLPMTAKPRRLSNDALLLIARRFAALADPLRLRLVHALFDGEQGVTALVEATGGTQANVSRHLKILTHAHVLSRRKEGLQVFYAIADPTIYKLCELVCGSLEKQLTKQAESFG
jgi:DNA-binding transcriptional ArsR family regulator